MPCDVLDLLAPTAVIHPERFEPALARELVETRLDDAQQGPRRDAVQRELDKRRRLTGIILVRINRVGMPGEREQPLGLDFLDHGLPADMLISGVGDLPARNLPLARMVHPVARGTTCRTRDDRSARARRGTPEP